MRKLGIYAVIVVLVGVVSSCLDDDNNYNYKQINEMQGGASNFENFNLDYSVIEGEEMLDAWYEACQNRRYREAYMDDAMEQIGAYSCEIRFEVEPLQEGRYLIRHHVRFD